VNLSIVNSTIINSSQYDLHIYSWDFDNIITSLNTTFNKSKVIVEQFFGSKITFEVKWYLHVNVTNPLGDPILNANVKVEDNENGTFDETWQTGSDGFVRWITTTEYTQNLTSSIFYTPHNVTVWKGTAYAHVNPQIDRSKTIDVTLEELPSLNLKCGWNPVSFKVIPSETDLDAVLQSIKGKYDWVQLYDSSDSSDPWKHYHAQKPAHLNDLKTLDHTMGFYLHINDTDGANLTINGSEPASTQYINLRKGWNFVGYPSLSDKDRTTALNNLTFDIHVDAIMIFNTTTQKWEKLGESDYFEVGRGYYIHAKSDYVWEVPL
jgi:hypothetical protein